MSRLCGKSDYCQFSPGQTTGGCPCAEHCKDWCEDARFITSTTAGTGNPTFWYATNHTDELYTTKDTMYS